MGSLLEEFGIKHVDILKIDIEGARERRIFQAAKMDKQG